MLLLLWLLLLISFWYLCGLCRAPQCFSVRSHGSQEKVFWHFQATSATGRFRECKTFLGTSATFWVCIGWARHNWGQDAGWFEQGHGVWTVGGEKGRWKQFLFPSPERIQCYLIHIVRALVTNCDHSRLQHNSVPSLTAPASGVVPMLSCDGREEIKLSVKDKATPALWLSWFISGTVWQSWESSARAEPTQPGVQPGVGPRIV